MPLKLYKTSIAGIERTLQLSDEDAARRGLTPADQIGEAGALDKPVFTGKGKPKAAPSQARAEPAQG